MKDALMVLQRKSDVDLTGPEATLPIEGFQGVMMDLCFSAPSHEPGTAIQLCVETSPEESGPWSRLYPVLRPWINDIRAFASRYNTVLVNCLTASAPAAPGEYEMAAASMNIFKKDARNKDITAAFSIEAGDYLMRWATDMDWTTYRVAEKPFFTGDCLIVPIDRIAWSDDEPSRPSANSDTRIVIAKQSQLSREPVNYTLRLPESVPGYIRVRYDVRGANANFGAVHADIDSAGNRTGYQSRWYEIE